jgi:hypothetical protein
MERIPKTNFIILSGSGKKVGKTFLAVALIRHFSIQSPIIALKISPHQHDKLGSVEKISETEGYRLFRESEVNEKNSGQFLNARAVSSFFLETGDGSLPDAIAEFSIRCNPGNLPVVCESGALGTIIKPGLLIYIDDQETAGNTYKNSIRKLADIVIPAKRFSPFDVCRSIQLIDNRWNKK